MLLLVIFMLNKAHLPIKSYKPLQTQTKTSYADHKSRTLRAHSTLASALLTVGIGSPASGAILHTDLDPDSVIGNLNSPFKLNLNQDGLPDYQVAFVLDVGDGQIAIFNSLSAPSDTLILTSPPDTNQTNTYDPETLWNTLEVYTHQHQLFYGGLPVENCDLHVYDSNGRSVFQTKLTDKKGHLTLPELPEGAYIVSLHTSGLYRTKKIFLYSTDLI